MVIIVLKEDAKNFNGHFQSEVVPCTPPGPPLCSEGRLWGGIQGSYEATITSFIPSAPALPWIQFYIGESIIQMGDGGSLSATDTGTFDTMNGYLAALVTITGGTGNLEEASGYLYISGKTNFATGVVEGEFKGEIFTLAAPRKYNNLSTTWGKIKMKD
jgi:hypothetical protein